jgi:hypothetical protein
MGVIGQREHYVGAGAHELAIFLFAKESLQRMTSSFAISRRMTVTPPGSYYEAHCRDRGVASHLEWAVFHLAPANRSATGR